MWAASNLQPKKCLRCKESEYSPIWPYNDLFVDFSSLKLDWSLRYHDMIRHAGIPYRISIHLLLLDSLLHIASCMWPMGSPRFLSPQTSSIVCTTRSNMSWSPSSTSRPSGSMGSNLALSDFRVAGRTRLAVWASRVFRDRWEHWKTFFQHFQRSALRVLAHDSGVCSLKHGSRIGPKKTIRQIRYTHPSTCFKSVFINPWPPIYPMANPQIWPSYLFVSYLFKSLPNFDYLWFTYFFSSFWPQFWPWHLGYGSYGHSQLVRVEKHYWGAFTCGRWS